MLENILDILAETHVQHLICFIKHEHPDRIKIQCAAFKVINNPSGCSDYHLNRTAKHLQLALDRLSAIDGNHTQSLFVFHQPGKLLGRLYCKFPGW